MSRGFLRLWVVWGIHGARGFDFSANWRILCTSLWAAILNMDLLPEKIGATEPKMG